MTVYMKGADSAMFPRLSSSAYFLKNSSTPQATASKHIEAFAE